MPCPSRIPQAHIHDGLLEAGSSEVGFGEVGIPQVGPIKASPLEVGPHEAGIPEVGSREVDPLQIGGGEFGSAKIRSDLGMVDSPVVPGVDACAERGKVLLVRHRVLPFVVKGIGTNGG